MHWRILPRRLWLVWLLLVAALSIIFYFTLIQGTKVLITDQQLKQQQTIARAEASNIVSVFQMLGNSVSVLAQLESIQGRSVNTVQDMDAFINQWRASGIMGGVILTNTRGVVLFNSSSLGTHDIGMSLADRDYMAWAKKNPAVGKYFIGTPVVGRIEPNKGKVVIPVASPVYLNGVFTGVVSAAVQLGPLTKHYLELMQVSDMTDVYLIEQNGDLLYSNPASDATGSNIFETIGPKFLDSQLMAKLKTALADAREGSSSVTYADPTSGKLEEHLVSYFPVNLDNQSWLLVMTTPASEVASLAAPFYIRQTSVLLVISLSLLLFGIIVSRENVRKKLE